MKITCGRDYVKFDFENGYTVKAAEEMLTGGRFVVYINTMKTWEPPHEKEQLSAYCGQNEDRCFSTLKWTGILMESCLL